MGWPSESELNVIRKKVAEMSGREPKEVRVVVSPYRICPLGAHTDHQGGTVSAMTINKGILLGFVPSDDSQVLIQSEQFKGEVRFSVVEEQLQGNTCSANEECNWGNYIRGALYALQKRGNHIKQGIIGFICGAEGLDSSGLSSSAATTHSPPLPHCLSFSAFCPAPAASQRPAPQPTAHRRPPVRQRERIDLK